MMTPLIKNVYCDTTQNHQKYLWITRSHHPHGADDFVSQLAGVGVGVYHAPLVHIEWQNCGDELCTPDDFSCLIFTSVHGVDGLLQQQFFDGHQGWFDTPCYGVSDKTAQYLRFSGFRDIRNGGGTAETLIQRAFDNFASTQKPALYARGVHITNDFSGFCSKQGFEIVQKIVYKNKYVCQLDTDIAIFLEQRIPDGILVQSVKTAENLVKIMDTVAGLQNVPLFCQSQNIANIFNRRTSVHVHVLQGRESHNWADDIADRL